MSTVSIIVAYANGRVIGRANDIPWHLPADLKRFKQLTTGHTVIMGRNTFDSIVVRLGRPLPNRRNIVLSHDGSLPPGEGYEVVGSLDEALTLCRDEDEVFMIGGAQLYASSLPRTDKIYLTKIEADVAGGDATFPELDDSQWRVVSDEPQTPDEANALPYRYITLERTNTTA